MKGQAAEEPGYRRMNGEEEFFDAVTGEWEEGMIRGHSATPGPGLRLSPWDVRVAQESHTARDGTCPQVLTFSKSIWPIQDLGPRPYFGR